ncbi:hypothetical protein ACFWWS_25690 [Streptomyces sp. NPDC059083]
MDHADSVTMVILSGYRHDVRRAPGLNACDALELAGTTGLFYVEV